MRKLEGVQSTQARIDKITASREVTTSIAAPTSVSADPPADPLTPLGDAYEFNASFNWVDPTVSALPQHILDQTELRDRPVLDHGPNTPGTIRWQLDAGVQQDTSDGVITYTFATWNHGVGLSNSPQFYQGQGYAPFTEAQIAAARIAVGNWDDLVAAQFVEIEAAPGASVFGKNSADIVLANTTTGPAQAEAYYPGLTPYFGQKYQRVEGDVWIADPLINGSNLQLLPGQYGLQALNHELGHSLGLSHPGAYNFGDDDDGDGQPDPINYTGDAFYFQDSHQYTIMSYFDAYETGGASIDWNIMRFIYPSTPMVDDVFVIQQKYGADMDTRAGATTYGFNATDDVTNAALRFGEGPEMLTAFTIWDAGGTDTLDLSGYDTNSVIDLREGAYSSAGGPGERLSLAEINANNAELGLAARSEFLYQAYFDGNAINPATGVVANEGLSWAQITGAEADYGMENNIGIAYGAIIENAVGGGGDDRINGNQANNLFTGGDGSDTFIFADYTGMVVPLVTGGTHTITDTSVDTITDFESGKDKIDLSELGVTYDDLSFDTSVANQTTVWLDRNGDGVHDDYSFVVQGDATVAGDYLFG